MSIVRVMKEKLDQKLFTTCQSIEKDEKGPMQQPSSLLEQLKGTWRSITSSSLINIFSQLSHCFMSSIKLFRTDCRSQTTPNCIQSMLVVWWCQLNEFSKPFKTFIVISNFIIIFGISINVINNSLANTMSLGEVFHQLSGISHLLCLHKKAGIVKNLAKNLDFFLSFQYIPSKSGSGYHQYRQPFQTCRRPF